jgi:hypothetical protein
MYKYVQEYEYGSVYEINFDKLTEDLHKKACMHCTVCERISDKLKENRAQECKHSTVCCYVLRRSLNRCE